MKNKVTMLFVMLFIMLFTVNVKAGEFWEITQDIEKGEDSRELYNSMPTSVGKGDIITVKVVLRNVQGWHISDGTSRISWDKSAFEIIENDGEYVKALSNNVEIGNFNFNLDNSLTIYYSIDDECTTEKQYIAELKFRVKNNVKDGIYRINQMMDPDAVTIDVDGDYEYSYSEARELKYQVGKTKLISNYTKDNIGNSTYIIGNHLFTRDSNDDYNGVLTTEYIMLAAKSIESDNKNDMIIYAKNARGNWINAITNQAITPPNEFNILYTNMKAVYSENGVYADSNEQIIAMVIQYNDREAIVTVESNGVRIHGVATISNKVATLKVKGYTCTINISDNEINLQTNVPGITNGRLQKRTNASIEDYYNDFYSYMSENASPLYYLNSGHTGKYTRGNYELYLLRTGYDSARICIKEKGQSDCIFSDSVYTNKDGYLLMGEETTYAIGLEEMDYGFDIDNSEVEIKCTGNCDSTPFVGKYSNKTPITFDETFHIWDKEQLLYRVEFDAQDGYSNNVVYIPAGVSINDSVYWYYGENHYRENAEFVEWQVNGVAYNLDTPVTGPITLVARYRDYHNVAFKVDNASYLSLRVLDGATVAKPNDPYRNGYLFAGWKLNGEDYNFNTPVTGDITLNASWTELVAPNIRTMSLLWNEGDQIFHQNLRASHSSHVVCETNNPNNCEYLIDGYEFYEKTGEGNVYIGRVGIAENINVSVSAGMTKTFVAKAYKEDANHNIIYSNESNEITIDLTNPVYTFDTTDTENDMYEVHGYIKDYEISLHGIKVNNTAYGYIVDKTLLDGVNTIILGIGELNASNPNEYTVEVEATKKMSN